MTGITRTQAEDFLYEEAHRLDSGQYHEWLALYDADCHYWMPIDIDEVERGQSVALQNADHQFLEISVNRLYVATAHSMLPKRRECRLVTNVAVLRQEADVTVVRSKLAMHEYRVREIGTDDERSFSATVHHGIRRSDSGLRIAWKRVDLINAEASLTAMPVPL